MDMKDIIRIGALMDLYENLLTRQQKNILHYYFNEDYSLFEISELTGATRQAAHDAIKRSLGQLEKYEEALGFYKRNDELKKRLADIKGKMENNACEAAQKELEALILSL